MTTIYIYIIFFLLLTIILFIWTISGARHVARGICEIKKIRNGIRDKKKEERKKTILNFLKGKKKVSNKEIRKELKVSGRTIINYCDELEKSGKIQQIGKTGRSTYYKLK